MKQTIYSNSPHTMCVCNYLSGHGLTFNCSINRYLWSLNCTINQKLIFITIECRSRVRSGWSCKERSVHKYTELFNINWILLCFVPALELHPHPGTLWITEPMGSIQENTVNTNMRVAASELMCSKLSTSIKQVLKSLNESPVASSVVLITD